MSSNHSKTRNNLLPGLILGILAFLRPLGAGGAENGEKTLIFSAGAAISGLGLNLEEPACLAGSSPARFSLGHVHSLGNGLARSSQMPELEPVETYGSFFGVKLTLKLKGGWNTFSGGDIKNGIGGMYDLTAHLISVDGVPITRSQKELPHDGLEFGGDLIYCITPRFGVGIGMSRINAEEKSVIFYEIQSPGYERININSGVKVSVLRLGLFYAVPFAGRLAISVHGGPALYSAQYRYNMTVMNTTAVSYSMPIILAGFLPIGLYQEDEAKQWGLEGGVGFEFNANPFVAFFLEALGRYAKIEGFEGKEEETRYINYRRQVLSQEGSLYLINAGDYPLLDIIPPEGSFGTAARKAVLDFSGLSFSAGLKLRF
ncbi:MAG: outer membrane beta-barrel protein [Candidatus Aminicenantales bacterium]